ncbi:caspase domain-containing protein [Mycena rosella]|uniref:Caspase domain-containing protein n=1 Tax=Mycena rosella TaxID=1033263 RepID=A0AAD7BY12_MYCRO|nr:caspase domain-containing protein [Mycena rosella]
MDTITRSSASHVPDPCLRVDGQNYKALLVYIRASQTADEDYPEPKAPHKDVEDIRSLLIDCYGYLAADITILFDDGISRHTQPTRTNILKAIQDLVKDAKAGDHFWFHYSGHSAQLKNRSNSEEDGKDECLIPLDGENQMIMDNELHAALVVPLPAGSQLVAVLDTCHSESLLDLSHNRCNQVFVPWILRGRKSSEELHPKVAVPTPPHNHQVFDPWILHGRKSSEELHHTVAVPISPPPSPRLLEMPRCESPLAMFTCTGWCRDPDKYGAEMEPPSDGVKADVISLASCKDSWVSWEDEEGSMTSSLVEILRRNPYQSLKEVLLHISHAMYRKCQFRHERLKMYERDHKKSVATVKKKNSQGRRRPMSLVIPEPPPFIFNSSTNMKQLVFDIVNFRNPELASSRPLDMARSSFGQIHTDGWLPPKTSAGVHAADGEDEAASEEEQDEVHDEIRLSWGEAEHKVQDILPTRAEEAVIAHWPKEKHPVIEIVSAQDLLPKYGEASLAALLLLPASFSAPNIGTRTVLSRLRMNIACFTVARSLEEAASDPDYQRVQKQVQEEWLKVGGLLVGLAALETAAFALAPDSLFSIDKVARITVSGSSISTGTGLLCDIYLLLRFSFAGLPVFKYRAQDNFEIRANGSINRTESYVFFALAARLPLFLAVISIFFIAVLLADVAYKISPMVVLSIVGMTGIILYLQYFCWAVIWIGFGLRKLLGWAVVGLSKGGTWPLLAFKYVAGKVRELWR